MYWNATEINKITGFIMLNSNIRCIEINIYETGGYADLAVE